jgi:hypothetical protein
MLLGIWKSVEELEMNISLNELEAILDAAADQEYRRNKFAAALKGVDLDAPSKEEAKAAVERARVRAQARLKGENPDHAELNDMGIDIEVE